MRKYTIVIYILLPLAIAISCRTRVEVKTDKPNVVVSILPVKYFVERIADSLVRIDVLVPPGSSPEAFEPEPQQMKNLFKADAYFAIGLLDFEKAILPKIKGTNAHLLIANLSDSTRLIEGECSHGEHNHGVDPHIWLSPVEAKNMAGIIYRSLSSKYPGYSERFLGNYTHFIGEINSTIDSAKAILANSPTRSFLIFHPALGYFARDFGLSQISIEDEGKTPSASKMLHIIAEAKRAGVKNVLIQSQFDMRNAEVVARELGGKVLPINPLGENWRESVLGIAKMVSLNSK